MLARIKPPAPVFTVETWSSRHSMWHCWNPVPADAGECGDDGPPRRWRKLANAKRYANQFHKSVTVRVVDKHGTAHYTREGVCQHPENG